MTDTVSEGAHDTHAMLRVLANVPHGQHSFYQTPAKVQHAAPCAAHMLSDE